MANEPDEIEYLQSSEQAELDETDQIEDLADDAGSSSATDETQSDALSVVRDVVAATEEEEGAEEEAGSSPDGEEETVETAEAATDDENYSDVPFHKHPRFQHLLREKKAAEVDAERYRNVESFLERSGLASEEAADGLEMMALAKTNPVEAWERIKPWVEKVATAAGVIMSPDLQQKVQSGEMTREAAIEVSKARAQVTASQTQQQFREQQDQRRQQTAAEQAIVSAATSWEAERQVKDPNFAAKVPALQRELAYLHATEGRPNTPQGVKEQCERAYKAVNTTFTAPAAQAKPARKPAVRPVTGGQVAGSATAEPNSTLDIIRANRRSG